MGFAPAGLIGVSLAVVCGLKDARSVVPGINPGNYPCGECRAVLLKNSRWSVPPIPGPLAKSPSRILNESYTAKNSDLSITKDYSIIR